MEKDLMPMLLKLFYKIEREGTLLNSFYTASISLITNPDKNTTKRNTIGQYP
jgi:hypothetical protein